MTAVVVAALLSAAQPPPLVVLLVPRTNAPPLLAERLRAELEVLGFDVQVDRLDDTGSVRDVLDATERPNLTAVLALATVGPEARAIDVWVSDRATGKTVLRRLKADGGGDQAGALALKAVELLRASLVELSFDAGRELPAVLQKLSAPPPPPPSPVSLQVGAGASFVRGAGPALHVGLGAAVRLPSVFVAELQGRVTVLPAMAQAMGGAVQVHEQVLLAGAGATFRLTPSLELGPSLLVGLARIEAQGVASDAQLVGRRLSNLSPSVEAGVAGRWWFSLHWGVSVRVGARFDTSPSITQAQGVDVVVAGLPTVAASVMLDVRP